MYKFTHKKFIELSIVMASLAWSHAYSSDTNCYNIKDKDQKNLCLANAKKAKSRCYEIKNHDKKNSCLANFKN